jgi:zona occludens toxin
MITLLTGQPGNGKTSWIINQIKKDIEAGRVVYTVGIPKLDLACITLPRSAILSWHERDIKEGSYDDDGEPIYLLRNIQEGSKIYVDEAQKSFAPSGTNVPEHINYLSEHRHHGLDFVFITQFPALVHTTVRALVTTHFHIRLTWSGRRIFEWPDWQNDPKSTTSMQCAVSKRYKIDKSTFKHYESASIHTKVKHTIPVKAFFFLVVLIITPFLVYQSVHRVLAKTDPNQKIQQQATASPGEIVFNSNVPKNEIAAPVQVPPVPVKATYKIYELPDIFDWQSVNACVASRSKCTCYDAAAVVLTIPEHVCRVAAQKGWRQLKLGDGGAEPHADAL